MLRKLLKHEFRATVRIMLPMYLVLLVTAIGCNLSGRGMLNGHHGLLNLLAVLIVTAFGIAIAGAFVLAFVLMIQRFYKNLLQDEGYVMLTLPVSIHQHIWSKLIVSAVWFAATVLAVILAAMVVSYDVGFLKEFISWFVNFIEGFRLLKISEALNGTVILIELAVECFLAMAAFSLQFYAALAAGHSRANHKMLWSVVLFFVFQFIVQFGGGMIFMGLDEINVFRFLKFLHNWEPSPIAAAHVSLLIIIALTVIYGAIFYAVTTFFLKRRLNLE